MRSTAIGFTEQNGLEKVVDGVPIGAIIPYAGSTAPFGTLICNGAAISRSAYPELFDAIGTTWGAGDGSTTFNIPDLRGYFLRGVGGNSAALAVEQNDAIRNIVGRFWDYLYQNTETGGVYPPGVNGAFSQVPNFQSSRNGTASEITIQLTGDCCEFSADNVVPTAAENRPINKAVNYIIVYE